MRYEGRATGYEIGVIPRKREHCGQTMRVPSGENATDETKSVNGPATVSPVRASHTRMVLSQ